MIFLFSSSSGTCPSGERYGVGDNKDNCDSLACEGGIRSSKCTKRKSTRWGHKRVVCGKVATEEEALKAKHKFFTPDDIQAPGIKKIGAAAQSGGYGGFCTSKEDMNPPPCGV